MEFRDRVALVTGGTGALGRSVAMDLLAQGARVAVTYIVDEEWRALANHALQAEERLCGMKVDLTRPDQVERTTDETLARWGRIDFLLAIAGGFAPGRSYESDVATWDRMLDLNLRSLVLTLRAVVPVMVRQNFGRIITVSSGAILRGGGPGIAAYAVSKGAVRQLSKILADELKPYDIRVNCIMPGTMDTEANRRAMPQADFSQWVKTEDVARVIRFLLSADARALGSVVVPVLG